MSLTIVAAAYREIYEPYMFVHSMLSQTNKNWKCIIYCDEPNQHVIDAVSIFKDERFKVVSNETATGYWGHFNRKRALHEMVDTEFVMQTSIQDYYTPNAIDEILSYSNSYDFIYFDMIHNHYAYDVLHTTPEVDRIDWGSYAVRTSIAREVDIENPKIHNSDGWFAQKCFYTPKVRSVKLHKIYAVHN